MSENVGLVKPILVSVNLNGLKATKAELTSGTSDTSLWPMAVEIPYLTGEKCKAKIDVLPRTCLK
jgi:hypothetical protein